DVAGAARQRGAGRRVPRDRFRPAAETAGHGLERRRVAVELRDLLEVGDGRTPATSHRAGICGFGPSENPRQGALARAVQADDADAFARIDREIGCAYDSVSTKSSVNALCGDD